MEIYGLTKTTLLDFPGLVASTIFVSGCNFRCPFCHNIDLVENPNIYTKISTDEVFSHINKRKNIIAGICITGGEPTLQKDLIPFITELRNFNLKIKLDTNGYRPDILNRLITDNLIDYIAMDIKASKKNYSKASGITINTNIIDESLKIISNGNIPYELRTTCVKGIHEEEDFYDISKWLPLDAKYYLQNFKENRAIKNRELLPFSKYEMNNFLEIVKKNINNVALRGID